LCSIRSVPLCATGATMGLSIEACRFNCHWPEKSGFCCASAVMVPARATTAAMTMCLGIVGLPAMDAEACA
jgi:hypothetical protein